VERRGVARERPNVHALRVPADLPEQLDRALRADTPWRQQLEPDAPGDRERYRHEGVVAVAERKTAGLVRVYVPLHQPLHLDARTMAELALGGNGVGLTVVGLLRALSASTNGGRRHQATREGLLYGRLQTGVPRRDSAASAIPIAAS